MPFERPTLQTIVSNIMTDLKAQFQLTAGFVRNSVFWVLAKVVAGASHLFYDRLDEMVKQLFVSTATGKFLELLGAEYGIFRFFGAKSTGSITVTGTDGVVIPAGTRFQNSVGSVYTSMAAATISANIASVHITAENTGSSYNADAGSALIFISPIAGINTDATVDSGGIVGGADADTDEQYRNRILSRKRQPPDGGNAAAYIGWMLEVDGVTRAWTFPQLYGKGTIGATFVKDNASPIIPTDADIENVRNYIVEHSDSATGKKIGCPVTADPGLFVIKPEPLAVNFKIKTSPYNSVTVSSMRDRISDLIQQRGAPNSTITISQMYEAITAATGEVASVIISPVADVSASYQQVPVVGDVVIEAL